jgi:hypothetical protein
LFPNKLNANLNRPEGTNNEESLPESADAEQLVSMWGCVEGMGISDDATKSQLTYAQAVKGLKKPVVKNSILLRTKDKRFSTMGATTTHSVVRFSTSTPRARE